MAPGIAPRWQVPPDVTQFSVAAVATTGVNLDLFYTSGDPDEYAANANDSATVNVSAPQVSPGLWASDIGQTGPFDGPAPHGTFTISATARGQLFDPAVSSTTGDVWAASVDPGANNALASLLRQGQVAATKISQGTYLATSKTAAPGSVSADAAAPTGTGPVTLFPGQSTTITVTITPTGAPHSLVRGHLYVDTFGFLTGSGDELIDLPYAYTVGRCRRPGCRAASGSGCVEGRRARTARTGLAVAPYRSGWAGGSVLRAAQCYRLSASGSVLAAQC